MDEERYIKGFNIGYKLNKQAPDIAKRLKAFILKNPESEYGLGFIAGQKEEERELNNRGKLESKHQDRLPNIRTTENDLGPGERIKSKTKDDKHHERDL